jgi:hypothetical protein
MSLRGKWLAICLIVLAFVIVGYLRDFIMVNINYLLDFVQTPDKEFYAHSFFDFLKTASFKQLYYGKYLLTLLFTLFNLALGLAFIRVIFKDKMLTKILVIIYVAVFLAAALIFVAGFLIGSVDQGYLFARALMGFLQSPVPCAILLLAYPLYKQNS